MEPMVRDACPACGTLYPWDREQGTYPGTDQVTITWTYRGNLFTLTSWLCPCNGVAAVALEVGTSEPEFKQRLYTCTLESLYAQAQEPGPHNDFSGGNSSE